MATPELGESATQLVAIIGAVGAVGTAALGLVDASKVAGTWGISEVGFSHIKTALTPFGPALVSAVGADWSDLFLAHWRNGKPKAEQKAIATALIQLGLDGENAVALAVEGHVDTTAFTAAIVSLRNGTPLTPDQVEIISRFRTSVEAKMDAAFERADQKYRNVARVWAGVIATFLALIGGWLLEKSLTDYVSSGHLGIAFIVGLAAVPIAPITKDLISSLSAAVRAVKVAKGG